MEKTKKWIAIVTVIVFLIIIVVINSNKSLIVPIVDFGNEKSSSYGTPLNETDALAYINNATNRTSVLSDYFSFCEQFDQQPLKDVADEIQRRIIYGQESIDFVCARGEGAWYTIIEIPQTCVDRAELVCASHNETMKPLDAENVRIVECVTKYHEIIKRDIDC